MGVSSTLGYHVARKPHPREMCGYVGHHTRHRAHVYISILNYTYCTTTLPFHPPHPAPPMLPTPCSLPPPLPYPPSPHPPLPSRLVLTFDTSRRRSADEASSKRRASTTNDHEWRPTPRTTFQPRSNIETRPSILPPLQTLDASMSATTRVFPVQGRDRVRHRRRRRRRCRWRR